MCEKKNVCVTGLLNAAAAAAAAYAPLPNPFLYIRKPFVGNQPLTASAFQLVGVGL